MLFDAVFVILLIIGLWRLLAKVPDDIFRQIGLMPEEEDSYL